MTWLTVIAYRGPLAQPSEPMQLRKTKVCWTNIYALYGTLTGLWAYDSCHLMTLPVCQRIN